MTNKLTVQQMLNDIGDHSVKVADITASLMTTGSGILKGQFWDLNDELCEGILSERWEPLTDLEKFQRLFEVVELWPCYSTASFLFRLHMIGVDAMAEAFLWRQMVLILEQGNKLHQEAIEYVLWVDFFEDQSTSSKAWNGVMTATSNKKARERLLVNSGPVPYSAKRTHYLELLKNSNDHEILAECLARSVQDHFGDIDRTEAKVMLAKLHVEPENEFMSYLRKTL